MDQASWLESEAEKIGVSQAEHIRQGIERLRAGPPARRPVDRRRLWRSREWLRQMAEAQRRANENWRYRQEQMRRGASRRAAGPERAAGRGDCPTPTRPPAAGVPLTRRSEGRRFVLGACLPPTSGEGDPAHGPSLHGRFLRRRRASNSEDRNHAGYYVNPSTTESWTEGFAG